MSEILNMVGRVERDTSSVAPNQAYCSYVLPAQPRGLDWRAQDASLRYLAISREEGTRDNRDIFTRLGLEGIGGTEEAIFLLVDSNVWLHRIEPLYPSLTTQLHLMKQRLDLGPSIRNQGIPKNRSNLGWGRVLTGCLTTFLRPGVDPVSDWFDVTSAYWSARDMADRLANPKKSVEESEVVDQSPEADERLLQNLAEAFWPFEQVHAVYVQTYRRELQVIVTLSVENYDRKLMKALIGAEYDLRKENPDIYFNFSYPPVGSVSRDDFMNPASRPLFSRFRRT